MLRSLLLPGFFFSLAIVASFPVADLGKRISFASSAKEAAPFAAPFALSSSLMIASLSLSLASALSPSPFARRSRRS
jgi:hypothetical protein